MMMKLVTYVDIPPSMLRIGYDTPLLLLGSWAVSYRQLASTCCATRLARYTIRCR